MANPAQASHSGAHIFRKVHLLFAADCNNDLKLKSRAQACSFTSF
jgi:hypothetical protein